MPIPKEGIPGMKENWKSDMVSGFLVFLIALPLCLGIAMASGFPPIAGIMTAVVGGLIVTFFQGSFVTIKGPAAGLIVIVYGSFEALGYEQTLAVIAVAGMVQILFGIFRTGVLGDFFPSSAVHGMLAAIGVIITAKQIHTILGVKPEAKESLELIAEIPHSLVHMNPKIAIIGFISLLILFVLPLIKNKYVKMIPAPMLVILIAIPLGHFFDLEHAHTYLFMDGQEYEIGPSSLVTLPDNLIDGITFPDFTKIFTTQSLYWVVMFAMVGSLESLLSTKAIDILDHYKRKSNLNKDLLAVGIGNTICGFIGALPMISEIVRSSANINNKAKTKWSNFYHGMFLLLFVAFAPDLIHQIPLAALGAMLIYTGYRLASPKVFLETLKVGKEQLLIFVTTLLVTLATDLIIGIASGILIEFILHIHAGAPLKSLFKSRIVVNKNEENIYTLLIHDAAIFSNYLGFKKHLDRIPSGNKIVLDFNSTKLIDHTVMEHIHHYGEDYNRTGGQLSILGLEKFISYSDHPLSYRVARKGGDFSEPHIPRSKKIKAFAKSIGFSFKDVNHTVQSNFGKLGNEDMRIKYEGNIITGKVQDHLVTISDLSLVMSGSMKAQISQMTVLSISNLHIGIPTFTLEKETLVDKLMDKALMNDIDFEEYPEFSDKYQLNGLSEKNVRKFFTPDMIRLFEKHQVFSVKSLGSEIILYQTGKMLNTDEMSDALKFINELMPIIKKTSEKEFANMEQ